MRSGRHILGLALPIVIGLAVLTTVTAAGARTTHPGSGLPNRPDLAALESVGTLVRGDYRADRAVAPATRGHALDDFADFKDNVWTEMFLHRWQVPPSRNWTALMDVGEPWPDGSGIFEMTTRHGPGFRFVQNEAVPRGSGSGVLMADVDHLLDQQAYLGTVTHFSGKVMFPRSGNPTGFPAYGDWNVLWEFSQSTAVHNLFGIDALTPGGPRMYVRTFDPASPSNRNGRKALARFPLKFDRWYQWRWQVRWSEGQDGFVNFWVNGQRVAAWTGPTLSPGSGAPYLELGWYGGYEPGRNEVRYAALRKL